MRTHEIRSSASGGAALAAPAASIGAPPQAAVMGRVKRAIPVFPPAAVSKDESRFLRVSDLERWALHTFGAAEDSQQQTGGFGAQPVRETIDSLAGWAGRRWRHWQQRRQTQATVAALSQLDRQTLRDIGIARSETLSLALEVEGRIEATRQRALPKPSQLPHQS